jgi:lipooligosaccharide transport system permease protein
MSAPVTTATPAALRVAETYAIAFRRTYRGSVFSTILNPILFLGAMGLGLGTLVDGGVGSSDLNGLEYVEFLAPGLLAATAMQTAAFETTYPVMAGFKWMRSYEAMVVTPLTPTDIAVGTVAWAGVRVVMATAAFVVVAALFGALASPLAVLAFPAAVLTGLAFAGVIAAWTAGQESEYALSNLFRFAVVPLFLFSGTFFPVEQLPDWLEPVAWVVPLWHGVELCRHLCLGEPELLDLVHVAYLTVWVVVGAVWAAARFRRRMVV